MALMIGRGKQAILQVFAEVKNLWVLNWVLGYTKLDMVRLVELQFKVECISQITKYVNNGTLTTLIGDIKKMLWGCTKGAFNLIKEYKQALKKPVGPEISRMCSSLLKMGVFASYFCY